MRVRGYLLLFLFFSVFLFNLAAQPVNVSVEHLTIDQGLPQNEVTSIIQDKKGFLWFGTRGGLARFDGHNMKVFQYEPGNKNSLSNNSVETLFESSDGKIWIGTKSGGLNCFDPRYESFRIYQFNAKDTGSISGNRVVSIAETNDGSIWAGTWQNGLNRLDQKTGKFHHLLEGRHVLALRKTLDGTLWIGSGRRLYKVQSGSRITQPIETGLSSGSTITSIIEDEHNARLLISGWASGLISYSYRSGAVEQLYGSPSNSDQANDLYSVLLDNKKNIWMGSWGKGLKVYDAQGNISGIHIAPQIQNKYNTDFDIILTLFQDRSDNIWIGTDGGGVCKLRKRNNAFKSFTFGNSNLSSGHILSLLEDSKGRVWIGTKGGGLNELKGEEIIHHKEIYDQVQDDRVNDIHTIYEDFNGVIWFGSNYGLHKITRHVKDKVSIETVTRDLSRENSLSDEKVMAILRDTKGRFWVGTQQQGLNRMTGTLANGVPAFKAYKVDEHNRFSLSENRVSVLFEDSSGRIWVGTYKGLHLYKEDIDGFIKLSHEPGNSESLSNDIVICITEDKEGAIWVGTAGGLNKVTIQNDVLKAKYLTKQDGLPNDYINSILQDKSGNFWISTNGGIFKFNPSKGDILFFNVRDGLQSNAFSENAACEGSSGLMYMGGINGFNVLDPAVELAPVHSPLSFVSLKLMNREVAAGEKVNDHVILEKSFAYTNEITLSHLDKVVSIEVAALDFTLPEKNQFAFRLEGFDNEWYNYQNQRMITYTNLKAGTYTLHVKSSDFGNVWVGDPISLKINVLPPPWKTGWAYAAYFTVALVVALIIRNVIKKQLKLKAQLRKVQVISEKAALEKQKEKEISEMKLRFFTNVSHELKTPLTLIISPLEELLTRKDVPGNFREKLLLMHRHSGRLLTLIHQLLDLRKSESGNMRLVAEQQDVVRFVYEVFESFIHLAEKRKINYAFQSDVGHMVLDFDQNKVEMAVTNILSNAFNYTRDGGNIRCHVGIEKNVEVGKTFCSISIQDTGRGMPKEALDKIFDLYYQVAVVDSVKVSGTGIGLSLVKEIVQLHEGLVTVDSTEGKGSTFTIKLPLKQGLSTSVGPAPHRDRAEPKPEHPANTAEFQEGDKPMLLVIEDTDELRHYVADLLHDEFQVIQASNGEDGLKAALEKIPDIVISDVMMEQMDGFDLCNRLKNNEKTSHIPVILLTAKTMPEHELSGLHAGADDYIRKPFNPTILIARVRRLLESHKKLKEYYGRKITLQPTNVEITSYDEKFLQKAMSYIEANLLSSELSTESLGHELGMSHSTLYRKIKALTGQSINGFIRSIRLKRAAQLLESGEYSVAEAAFETGFSEVKYFRTYFKEQFGCLPSEYAKSKNTTPLQTD